MSSLYLRAQKWTQDLEIPSLVLLAAPFRHKPGCPGPWTRCWLTLRSSPPAPPAPLRLPRAERGRGRGRLSPAGRELPEPLEQPLPGERRAQPTWGPAGSGGSQVGAGDRDRDRDPRHRRALSLFLPGWARPGRTCAPRAAAGPGRGRERRLLCVRPLHPRACCAFLSPVFCGGSFPRRAKP